MSLESEIIVD